MSRPVRSTEIVKPLSRPGDGSSVPIVKRTVPQVNGATTLEVSLNLADAPVPDRRYHADTAGLVRRGETVMLTFGQLRLSGDGPTSGTPVVASSTSAFDAASARGRDADLIRSGDWAKAQAYLDALPALPRFTGEDPPLPEFDLD